MKISQNAKNAIMIGTLCSISYFAVYVSRNILSALSPQFINSGIFNEEFIGLLSSLFFICYAVGQLINGAIGDKIKAKYMVCGGLIFSGILNMVFSFVTKTPYAALAAYGLTGFSLSMIYGPMTKIVSENTEPLYASRCSVGYTFAAFFGSPAAGALAAIMTWQSVFISSSAFLIVMAIIAFIVFSLMERRGIVTYGRFNTEKKGALGNVKQLFKRHIVKFSIVSILTGIVRTSVVFWLPTYISQYLEFDEQTSALLFTVATLVISFSAFIAVTVYEKLGNNMHLTVLLMFIASALFFAMTYLIKFYIANIIFIVLAILAANSATSVLWSIYCPSLRDTGIVSSVTGFLDFLSYSGAAIANIVFANAINTIGWKNLILVWFLLMVLGIIVCIPLGKNGKVKSPSDND